MATLGYFILIKDTDEDKKLLTQEAEPSLFLWETPKTNGSSSSSQALFLQKLKNKQKTITNAQRKEYFNVQTL